MTAAPPIPDSAISLRFVRSGGPGGQNVNKVATAVQLRFDASAWPAPAAVKARLQTLAGRRMTDQGVLIIAAQRFRTQEQNKRDAFERLGELIAKAMIAPVARRATKPTRASKERRLESKQRRSGIKRLRTSKVDSDS